MVEHSVRVFAVPSVAQQQWQGCAAFIAVERHGVRDGQPFHRQSWFILSQVISATQAVAMIRKQRSSIETKVHWVKDVVQGEFAPAFERRNLPPSWHACALWQ